MAAVVLQSSPAVPLSVASVSAPVRVVPAATAAVNATANLTGAQVAGGRITSTSAAAVTMTMPSAAALNTALTAAFPGAAPIGAGYCYDFVIDNSGGANAITVAGAAGLTLTTGTGVTVAAGSAAQYRLYWTAADAAILFKCAN